MPDLPEVAIGMPPAPEGHDTATAGLALWAVNLARPISDLDAWSNRLAIQARRAADAGLGMLILPEYACAQWLHLPDAPTDPRRQIGWMADQAAKTTPNVAQIARETGIDILAGTWPWIEAGGAEGHNGPAPVNRALFCRPDGTTVFQDKLTLTPGERDADSWTLAPGAIVTVFNWRGWRTAIVVCLDIEQPSLAAKLAPFDLDLVLVPSMTAGATGYHRVHACARARAVELMSVVAVVGTIGTLPDGSTNNGGAAVYTPCEGGLADGGFMTGTGRLDGHHGDGPILAVPDLPLAAVRAMRHGGAEVWPGPWDASAITVTDKA